MKKVIFAIALLISSSAVFGQKVLTKNGKVHFDATSPNSPEKIDATNDKTMSVIDASTGAIEFALLMKAFSFEKALMQEHFNENYVESDKFPKASFKGTITNMSSIDLKKDGTYPATVKGQMTLHGETKEISATGNITVKGGSITAAKSEFSLMLADYKIEVPSVVKDKVSKEAKITVDLSFQPMAAK